VQNSPVATMGGMSGSDKPVEAVEAIKAISENEEVDDEFLRAVQHNIALQQGEEHMQKVESWENLSEGQLGMKIASAGLTMGIQSSYYSSRSDERRLEKAIEKILQAIQSGNLDAISLALILIARRSKEQLRKAALTVIESMKYYEEQQAGVNKQLEKLVGKGDGGTYGAELMQLNNEMNMFSTNRQAAVSILRDIKGASDELDNTAKSWLDVKGPHERALARWTA